MDKIKIEGLEVFCNHGLLPEETKLGQKFIVNATLCTDTMKAGLKDDLDASIDYAEVSHMISEFMTTHTYKLIEAVAENLARLLLHEIASLKSITLEIKKPWAPIGLHVESASVEITRSWHEAYISTGSNLGDSEGFLTLAEYCLSDDPNCRVIEVAPHEVTNPYGVTDQPYFLNGMVKIKTLLSPIELLSLCNEIEQKANRTREMRWGPRTLDLDIIFYDDAIIEEADLIIPHIDMQNREFVLKPLSKLAPNKLHPVLKKRVVELVKELDEKSVLGN